MRILIVDDEAIQRDLLRGFLENQGYQVSTASNGKEALTLFQHEPVQLVILDQRMPGLTGKEVLQQMKAINPTARAVMITAYGDVDTAVAVMKLDADDFLEKPVDLPMLLEKVRQIEQMLIVEEDVAAVEASMDESPLPLKIVAQSPAMKKVLSLVRRVAISPWPILIQGETGTGKELVAQLIHLLSPRQDNPFIELNCAAIPENLFESELFGHEKGSFTGAVNRRRGRFELADTGTLFLDEIGEMPLVIQPKLLRALQEQQINRVGSEEGLSVNIRLVSASNRDLKQLCAESLFREDLYYRIKVLEIEIPPLRRHREDIPALVEFFMERYAGKNMRFAPEALDILIKYPFPGNVRELEHVVQRTVTLTRGQSIYPADLPEEIRHHQATTQGTLAERLESVEKEMLLSALEASDWVQTRAAELLGISERVLRYKIEKYGTKAFRRK
jgi:DNA-binding NtrC family response regulator